MAFTDEELTIIEGMSAKENLAGYPFMFTNAQLDLAVAAIKRERGDEVKQLRRQIRTEFAKRHNLTFAMDGGFMDGHRKFWADGHDLFGKLFQEYEELIMALRAEGRHGR